MPTYSRQYGARSTDQQNQGEVKMMAKTQFTQTQGWAAARSFKQTAQTAGCQARLRLIGLRMHRRLCLALLSSLLCATAAAKSISLPGGALLDLPEGAEHRVEERHKTTFVAPAPGLAVTFSARPNGSPDRPTNGLEFIRYLAANNPGQLVEEPRNSSLIFVMSRRTVVRDGQTVQEIHGAIGFSSLYLVFSALASEEFVSPAEAQSFVQTGYLDILSRVKVP
ncbi:hypothetical protein [Ideonella sp.]|jgi:hypothetical protein|uniref:hypothetical protein n=1 Tax=Ideonella sp. TaxID=1929293 RepID=UPI0037C16715